jgi:hypothetical protein
LLQTHASWRASAAAGITGPFFGMDSIPTPRLLQPETRKLFPQTNQMLVLCRCRWTAFVASKPTKESIQYVQRIDFFLSKRSSFL